ncbi:GNAT family N-acetyltransferase [Novosphingobium sp. MBES04]|uniref:GNAT family N-acetyltransferase n=1 Tax=Novosphingobium sp. MBES04 TaxID=1206458 RepID=UPI00057EE6FF|nr:GNAT family N-acetyltransferase [Novosphingobium sp. MBES04]
MHQPLATLPQITSARLSIRPLLINDVDDLAGMTDDPAITDVIHFLPSPFTRSDAFALIGQNDDRNCFLGAFLDGGLIGVVGTHLHDEDRLEIGYWIASRHQRQGFALEAVSNVISRIRELYPKRQITAECRIGNEASWALLHKLGFRSVGRPGDRPGRELLICR